MKQNKYEKELIDNAANLDSVTQSNGRIIECVKLLIENHEKEAILLCKYINKATEYKNAQITRIAISTKDALISYYGHKQLTDICSNEIVQKEENHSLEELMEQLNSLIGLEKVKSKVNDLIAFQKVQLLRKAKGLHSPKNTMHLAFTGNPGTGKTTVARIVGRIYKKIGLLSKGHFMEVSRTDLIAGYQGQTALKVKEVIEKAKGGVLFIDEAYSITENDHSDSYGRECLTELTKALEDYRQDLVVIVAGYSEPMKQFFDSNPGLKSRFNTFIEFEDYNDNELFDILQSMCHKEDYTLSEELKLLMRNNLKKETLNKETQFSNGRFIRNLFEEMIMNQARRLSTVVDPTIEDLKKLYPVDFTIISQSTKEHNIL
ncbi:AAA family ATPase [Bacteroides heparinolyticus]|uniref:AAA family ATPase n=1 Tax=Prevotella heparinolytica TaxID=28113 RepID=UPI0035A107E8